MEYVGYAEPGWSAPDPGRRGRREFVAFGSGMRASSRGMNVNMACDRRDQGDHPKPEVSGRGEARRARNSLWTPSNAQSSPARRVALPQILLANGPLCFTSSSSAPEIPPNTGNAIRLAACTGALSSLRAVDFLPGAPLRRAGLDYHYLAHVTVHRDLDDAFLHIGPTRRVYAFATSATTPMFVTSAVTSGGSRWGLVRTFSPDLRSPSAVPDPDVGGTPLAQSVELRRPRDLRSLRQAWLSNSMLKLLAGMPSVGQVNVASPRHVSFADVLRVKEFRGLPASSPRCDQLAGSRFRFWSSTARTRRSRRRSSTP